MRRGRDLKTRQLDRTHTLSLPFILWFGSPVSPRFILPLFTYQPFSTQKSLFLSFESLYLFTSLHFFHAVSQPSRFLYVRFKPVPFFTNNTKTYTKTPMQIPCSTHASHEHTTRAFWIRNVRDVRISVRRGSHLFTKKYGRTPCNTHSQKPPKALHNK